ncbi:cellulose synthase catalytic subunit [Klebsiella pneumoniae]|uniref:Cellulose synthase catalytic subunit n=1 Tax=Klebsiella pneumoniae TaxID=573 RepID=A0A377YRP7_KLEPN|nr:cellulose synthase catalytic subunit [Klebsiella pneumoniae]
MIRLSTLLLAPPVGERLRARYDDYRQHGASWLSASLGCLWASLVWALMPLETPRWQAILARHETYFPHKSASPASAGSAALPAAIPVVTDDARAGAGEKGQLAFAGGAGRGARSLYAVAGKNCLSR